MITKTKVLISTNIIGIDNQIREKAITRPLHISTQLPESST